MDFDTAFDRLIGHEGGYSNHPDDPGGETMWGVTAAVARGCGYSGEMQALSRDQAKDIYRSLYWNTVHGDELPGAVAFQVFDAAVNHGVRQASKWLQQAAGVSADGKVGPLTLAAVRKADSHVLAFLFNAARLMFYTDLNTWPSFGKGWARRVAGNLRYAAKDA